MKKIRRRRLLLFLILTCLLVSALAGCGKKPPDGNGDPEPSTRPLNYFDDFSDPTSGWVEVGGNEIKYVDGEYMIRIGDSTDRCKIVPEQKRWLTGQYRVAVKVKYQIYGTYGNLDADQPICGLLFNDTGTYMNEDYYIFAIYPDVQQFFIVEYNGYSEWWNLKRIYRSEESLPYINKDIGEWNWLAVKVDHGQAWFYINNETEPVYGPVEVRMHPDGEKVGLYVSNARALDFCVHVRFDDFHLTGTELVKAQPY